ETLERVRNRVALAQGAHLGEAGESVPPALPREDRLERLGHPHRLGNSDGQTRTARPVCQPGKPDIGSRSTPASRVSAMAGKSVDVFLPDGSVDRRLFTRAAGEALDEA